MSRGTTLLIRFEYKKRAVPQERNYIRGTTLLISNQINSWPCNGSYSGATYSYFNRTVQERTSHYGTHRFAPTTGSLRGRALSFIPVIAFDLRCILPGRAPFVKSRFAALPERGEFYLNLANRGLLSAVLL